MTAKAHNYIQLSKLQELSASLLRARTPVEVAEIIIKRGLNALGALSGDVSLFNQDTKKLEVLAKKGYPTKVITEFHDVMGKTPLLTSHVLKTRQPYYIKSVDTLDKRYMFAQSFIRFTGSQAAALLPLQVTNKTLGVLQFTFKDTQKFTEEDKNFMLSLADQCAQALDKIIALEDARRSKDELGTILRTIADGVIVRNRFGTITYANSVALRIHECKNIHDLLGMSSKKYLGLFSQITNGKETPIAPEQFPFMKVLGEGKKYEEKTVFAILKKSQSTYWLRVTSVPILNSVGEIDFVTDVIQDITLEKQNESSKDEFFAIASHELRTPVTSLKAYTQVLKKRFEQEGNPQTASFLQKMDFQIDKLTNLIHDLLDVTKIEGGKMQFNEELIEFNVLASEIVEDVQWTTERHTIVLEKTKDVVIRGDRERIGQVITNFLTNAIKYSPGSSDILAKVHKNKHEMIFSVRDFGIGVKEKDQKHIFERFYRERNLKGDTFPGLGLGLYIAAEIIKRQHGKIWVESKKGKGSTFFFSIPLYKK